MSVIMHLYKVRAWIGDKTQHDEGWPFVGLCRTGRRPTSSLFMDWGGQKKPALARRLFPSHFPFGSIYLALTYVATTFHQFS